MRLAEKIKDKKVTPIPEKRVYEQDFIVSSNNALSLDRNIIKSFLVTRRSPLALLQSPWVFSSFHSIRKSNQEYSTFF